MKPQLSETHPCDVSNSFFSNKEFRRLGLSLALFCLPPAHAHERRLTANTESINLTASEFLDLGQRFKPSTETVVEVTQCWLRPNSISLKKLLTTEEFTQRGQVDITFFVYASRPVGPAEPCFLLSVCVKNYDEYRSMQAGFSEKTLFENVALRIQKTRMGPFFRWNAEAEDLPFLSQFKK